MTARRPSRAPLAAAAMSVLAVALVGFGISQQPEGSWWLSGLVLLLVTAPGVVGVLVVRRDPRHRIGWLLCAHSLMSAVAMMTPPPEPRSTAGLAVAQATQGSFVLFFLGLVLIAMTFPDGRFRNARWRRWTWVCVAGYTALGVGSATDAAYFRDLYDRDPPLPTLPRPLADTLDWGGFVVVVLSLLSAVVVTRLRLREARGEERLQLLWFSWAAISIPLALGTCILDQLLTGGVGTLTVIGICVFGSVVPVAIGIAILRTRLFDIELVLSRTLTYGLLTAVVVGVYAVALVLAGRVLGNDSVAGLIGVGVVAVAVQPVHGWLRRRAERWVYGDRSEPGVALRRLSDRVETATDPAHVVESVTGSVRDALRVDRAWIETGEVVEADGRDVRVPLVHRGERLGDLAVQVPRGRTLSTADLALLHDLARYAAVVVQAARLTADLQASRAKLVTAREEERRRLRRDLHDGLGPSLAAIVLELGAAQQRRDETERAELVGQAMAETREAIAEVRRLVDDLRPPAIDEVGLLGAVRQRAASLTQGTAVSVEVAGPAALPPLPAAVEVAAFRIASEALTNVVRHSGASRCHVHVAVDGGFELTVSDDGRGAALGTGSGVGWTSMSERAEELGGTCTVSSRAGGGLVVRAVLPLAPVGRPEHAEAES